jgi:hypothetical protein
MIRTLELRQGRTAMSEGGEFIVTIFAPSPFAAVSRQSVRPLADEGRRHRQPTRWPASCHASCAHPKMGLRTPQLRCLRSSILAVGFELAWASAKKSALIAVSCLEVGWRAHQ